MHGWSMSEVTVQGRRGLRPWMGHSVLLVNSPGWPWKTWIHAGKGVLTNTDWLIAMFAAGRTMIAKADMCDLVSVPVCSHWPFPLWWARWSETVHTHPEWMALLKCIFLLDYVSCITLLHCGLTVQPIFYHRSYSPWKVSCMFYPFLVSTFWNILTNTMSI
jgi:hypothetical protein